MCLRQEIDESDVVNTFFRRLSTLVVIKLSMFKKNAAEY